MKPFLLSNTGQVLHADGRQCEHSEVSTTEIAVDHLEPHVETFQLDATDAAKTLIRYSCHCWTCGWSDQLHAGQTRFLDHKRSRAFDPVRYNASAQLVTLMRDLPANRIYVTRSDRNYGCYNATLSDENGHFYTAYFTVRPQNGKFSGVRHKFVLFVESAYPRIQQEPGMKTNFRAIIGKAREGRMVKYRP